VGTLLARPELVDRLADARGDLVDPAAIRLRAPITRPGKIICVGLNYHGHCREQSIEAPAYPMLFSKFANAVADPGASVTGQATEKLDLECELAVIIGAREGVRWLRAHGTGRRDRRRDPRSAGAPPPLVRERQALAGLLDRRDDLRRSRSSTRFRGWTTTPWRLAWAEGSAFSGLMSSGAAYDENSGAGPPSAA